MADNSPVKEKNCSEDRKDIYERLSNLEKEVATMQGERKHARYITPLIVAVILTLGGVIVTSVIKNSVREAVKEEVRSLNKDQNSTSLLITKYP